jgi:hypothetical protein
MFTWWVKSCVADDVQQQALEGQLLQTDQQVNTTQGSNSW